MKARSIKKNLRTRITAAVLTVAGVGSMLAIPGTAPGALGDFANSISITADAASDSAVVISKGCMKTDYKYYSPNRAFYVVLQSSDGNVVLRNASNNAAIWSAGTNGNKGAFAQIQDDGNFVVYASNKTPKWASNTDGRGKGCTVNISNSGELYVANAKGQKYWSSRSELTTVSGAGKTDSLGVGDILCSPNRQFWAVLQGDGNFVVYKYRAGAKWSSETNGRVKPARLSIQTDGNLVLYGTTNDKWCTGVTPYSKGDHRLVLDNNGNLSVVNTDGIKIWSSEARPFIWPVPSSNKLTACFKETEGHAGSFHGAIDIGGNYGDTIIAARDGKVIVSDYQPGGLDYSGAGYYVVIEHSIGGKTYWTTYMHLSNKTVYRDQQVKAGDKIGEMGNTGSSSRNPMGVHLDYSVRAGGTHWYNDSVRLDPLAYTKVPSNLYDGSWTPQCCGPYVKAATRFRNCLYALTDRKEF